MIRSVSDPCKTESTLGSPHVHSPGSSSQPSHCAESAVNANMPSSQMKTDLRGVTVYSNDISRFSAFHRSSYSLAPDLGRQFWHVNWMGTSVLLVQKRTSVLIVNATSCFHKYKECLHLAAIRRYTCAMPLLTHDTNFSADIKTPRTFSIFIKVYSPHPLA
jgi:hypothetical protein